MPEQTQPSPIRHDVFLSPIPCRTAPGDPKRPPRAKGPLPHVPSPRAVGSSFSLRIAARPLVTPFHPPRMATVARCHLPIKNFGCSHDIKSNLFNRGVGSRHSTTCPLPLYYSLSSTNSSTKHRRGCLGSNGNGSKKCAWSGGSAIFRSHVLGMENGATRTGVALHRSPCGGVPWHQRAAHRVGKRSVPRWV